MAHGICQRDSCSSETHHLVALVVKCMDMTLQVCISRLHGKEPSNCLLGTKSGYSADVTSASESEFATPPTGELWIIRLPPLLVTLQFRDKPFQVAGKDHVLLLPHHQAGDLPRRRNRRMRNSRQSRWQRLKTLDSILGSF